ncbi:glycosyltransferase family 4 protein [Streptomyces sp. NPDC003710]
MDRDAAPGGLSLDQLPLVGGAVNQYDPGPVPDEPRVLFVGSLEQHTAYKGLSELLAAAAELKEQGSPVRLEVVGDGTATGNYRRTADRLGLGGKVTFSGRLYGADLAAAYWRARVLALPTSYDSFPSVLVEAMAARRPVVTTRVGGIPSLVRHEDNGLLVAPGDRTGLRSALTRVLTDDALADRLAAAGLAHVRSKLGWGRQATRTADVFARVLEGRRPPGDPSTLADALVSLLGDGHLADRLGATGRQTAVHAARGRRSRSATYGCSGK